MIVFPQTCTYRNHLDRASLTLKETNCYSEWLQQVAFLSAAVSLAELKALPLHPRPYQAVLSAML